MEHHEKIYVFLDEQEGAIAELTAPVQFELDTTQMKEGIHQIRILNQDNRGHEDTRIIPFEIKTHPSLPAVGIQEYSPVNGIISVKINPDFRIDQENLLSVDAQKISLTLPDWLSLVLFGLSCWVTYYIIGNIHLLP
ncbi:MAG: hypothetical protein ACYCOO_08445 [Chitinophagaceae bacterium]